MVGLEGSPELLGELVGAVALAEVAAEGHHVAGGVWAAGQLESLRVPPLLHLGYFCFESPFLLHYLFNIITPKINYRGRRKVKSIIKKKTRKN